MVTPSVLLLLLVNIFLDLIILQVSSLIYVDSVHGAQGVYFLISLLVLPQILLASLRDLQVAAASVHLLKILCLHHKRLLLTIIQRQYLHLNLLITSITTFVVLYTSNQTASIWTTPIQTTYV